MKSSLTILQRGRPTILGIRASRPVMPGEVGFGFYDTFNVPLLASDQSYPQVVLYSALDLRTYLTHNWANAQDPYWVPPTIVGGEAAPGFLVGTEPITFTPGVGFTNPAPFDGVLNEPQPGEGYCQMGYLPTLVPHR